MGRSLAGKGSRKAADPRAHSVRRGDAVVSGRRRFLPDGHVQRYGKPDPVLDDGEPQHAWMVVYGHPFPVFYRRFYILMEQVASA